MSDQMSATRGAWPLVGRDGELAEIAAARVDPECPAVLISAPAGLSVRIVETYVYRAMHERGVESRHEL